MSQQMFRCHSGRESSLDWRASSSSSSSSSSSFVSFVSIVRIFGVNIKWNWWMPECSVRATVYLFPSLSYSLSLCFFTWSEILDRSVEKIILKRTVARSEWQRMKSWSYLPVCRMVTVTLNSQRETGHRYTAAQIHNCTATDRYR